MKNLWKGIGCKSVALIMATLLGVLACWGLGRGGVAAATHNSSNEAAYEVHEWGVLVGCEGSGNYRFDFASLADSGCEIKGTGALFSFAG